MRASEKAKSMDPFSAFPRCSAVLRLYRHSKGPVATLPGRLHPLAGREAPADPGPGSGPGLGPNPPMEGVLQRTWRLATGRFHRKASRAPMIGHSRTARKKAGRHGTQQGGFRSESTVCIPAARATVPSGSSLKFRVFSDQRFSSWSQAARRTPTRVRSPPQGEPSRERSRVRVSRGVTDVPRPGPRPACAAGRSGPRGRHCAAGCPPAAPVWWCRCPASTPRAGPPGA